MHRDRNFVILYRATENQNKQKEQKHALLLIRSVDLSVILELGQQRRL